MMLVSALARPASTAGADALDVLPQAAKDKVATVAK